MRDRVVQAALKLVLEPIFEADFHPCSYGFRPSGGRWTRSPRSSTSVPALYEWVLEADIEACFDAIDHAALMDRVRAGSGTSAYWADQGVPEGWPDDR